MKDGATSSSTQKHTSSIHIAEEQDDREYKLQPLIFVRSILSRRNLCLILSTIHLAVAPARLTTTPGGLIFTGHTSVLPKRCEIRKTSQRRPSEQPGDNIVEIVTVEEVMPWMTTSNHKSHHWLIVRVGALHWKENMWYIIWQSMKPLTDTFSKAFWKPV